MTEDFSLDPERAYKVVVVVRHSDRDFVHMVANQLTYDEAVSRSAEVVADAQNGLFIPVMGGIQPKAVNPRYIVEVSVERWLR